MGKEYRKTATITVIEELPNGVLVRNTEDVEQEDAWVIPLPTFNATYEPVGVVCTFGDALDALKAGKKVARRGWNGKGIFIELQRPDEHSKMTHPYIYIDATGLQTDNPHAPKNRVPWLASQTDMLAEDWTVIE